MTSNDLQHAFQRQEELNKKYLRSHLDIVKARLERQLAISEGDQEGISGADEQIRGLQSKLVELGQEQNKSYPLNRICESFGLSPFERELLLLCTGAELDTGIGQLCAALQCDPRKIRPTFSLCLALLQDPHWSALSPSAPLRYWRLIEVGPGDTLTSSPLRIDERVLHHLLGVYCLDERLRGMTEPAGDRIALPASHLELAERIVDFLTNDLSASSPVIQLWGSASLEKRAIAQEACSRMGMILHILCSSDIPNDPSERAGLIRLWERETILSPVILIVDFGEIMSKDANLSAVHFLEKIQSPVMVGSLQPLRLSRKKSFGLDVGKPRQEEQRDLWRSCLGPLADDLDGNLEAVIAQFDLGLDGISAAGSEFLALKRQACHAVIPESSSDGDARSQLWDACRRQSRPRLDDLAHRIPPVATWEDLVLPAQQLLILQEIASHVRQRWKVYGEWGFSSKSSSALGVSALFSGESGTGKTMAAEVLASELRLDLYRIDLSQVVSKYIGETEKNLRRVFDAAEDGGAILLFDEADALFGKRSEVKDSHDRYANIEISYLLQRMEAYRGLAILTTNMRSALDRAFLRRIRFMVQFSFPGAAERGEIWRRIFPKETPTDGLDYEKLSRLNVAGGNIRNIALYGAFLAADAGESVSMSHLLRAARVEYAKMERAPTEVEIGGWV